VSEFTAAKLKEHCERGREVGKPTSGALSVTGEPYFVIGSQIDGTPKEPGTIDEGQEFEWAFDEETAFFQAWNCFERYAHGKSGKLYWRIGPDLEERNIRNLTSEGPKKLYQFYMRCLISDKPEIS
jgi:hypothetical protein